MGTAIAMTETAPHDAESLRTMCRRHGQAHVFTFWEALSADQRAALCADLAAINFEALPTLMQLATQAVPVDARCPVADLQPPAIIAARGEEAMMARRRGAALIAAGKVAALTVAGGQGTRLGFDGPKGAFPISPIRDKPLFQLFAEALLAAQRRYETRLRWYVMTGPANHDATETFLAKHRWFGLDADQIVLFQQGVMPVFDPSGRILLDQKHRVSLAPDGHGGCLLALATRGMLRDMASHGVELISYFQVDNPLVSCIDPIFIGMHDLHRSEMSSKTMAKADDFERVGNFVTHAGRLSVIEYSDFPDDLATARNENGTRRYDAANIAIHLISRAFVERLTANPAAFALPWHRAAKKAPYVDLATGGRATPDEPNAVKLESFVFDALPLADIAILVQAERAEEFSPVKNAEGVDSVETARQAMVERSLRWLRSHPRGPQMLARHAVKVAEISPLFATDMSQVEERTLPEPAGSQWYVE